MKEVEHYSNLFEAELDRALLEDSGVPAVVLNKNVNCVGWANNDLLAYKLMVNDGNCARAKEILKSKVSIGENHPVE